MFLKSLTLKGFKSFADTTVMDLEPGVTVVVGPNGSGKTTLFNALSGLVDVESGSLEINGKSHKWPKPHQLIDLGISRTLQGVGLFPELTVLENVMIGDTKSSRSGLISGDGANSCPARPRPKMPRWYKGTFTVAHQVLRSFL